MSCISQSNLPVFLVAGDHWFLLCSRKPLTGPIYSQPVSIPITSLKLPQKVAENFSLLFRLENSVHVDKPQ